MLSRLTRVINPLRNTTSALVRSVNQLYASVMHVDLIQQPTASLNLHTSVLTRSFATYTSIFDKFQDLSVVEVCKGVNTSESVKVCKEAADLLDLNAQAFHKKLAAFFIEGNETMKRIYDNSFLKYIIGTMDGIAKAIIFSNDQEKAKEKLKSLYKDDISYGLGSKIWSFLNVTARSAHLYGPKEYGFLTFEDVVQIEGNYNRFGLHGKDEDSTFQLLTRKETIDLIVGGKITPREALFYAEQLRLDPNADNILKEVNDKVLESNRQRSLPFFSMAAS